MNDGWLDQLARDNRSFIRGAVRLKEEEPPPIVMLWSTPPPEGCRWESDDEFRARIESGDQKTPWPESTWPLVDERDDGIRPAGPQDACLYCQQKVGQPHGRDCVVIFKKVEMRVIAKLPDGRCFKGLYQFDEVHSFDAHMSEFSKNESSWCASNFLSERGTQAVTWDEGDPWDDLERLSEECGCLCELLEFTFLRVVDDTPRRAIRL